MVAAHGHAGIGDVVRTCQVLQALQVLCFSRHVQLRNVAEADAAAHHQSTLTLHASRTLALPVGRGALTLSTADLLPTEPLTAHKFCLHGARFRRWSAEFGFAWQISSSGHLFVLLSAIVHLSSSLQPIHVSDRDAPANVL